MERTVTSDGEVMVAAGRGVKQNQRAHDDLRAGGYRRGGGGAAAGVVLIKNETTRPISRTIL